ncbi:MAG: winged helix-turn-helix domain-containing protein [Chloroflexota bacterium]|nr:winged helix-turn-helix domain-containing protein [Chloroflexota bacterium]
MARKREREGRDGGVAAGELGSTLAHLQERIARLEGQVFGERAVGMDGAVGPDGNAIFAVPLDGSVRVLAALASMPRLALYRAVLEHPATSGELMKAAGLNTTGQLYHHLRELIGAGLIAQEGRDRYALVPERLPAARSILGAALGVAQAANLTADTPA